MDVTNRLQRSLHRRQTLVYCDEETFEAIEKGSSSVCCCKDARVRSVGGVRRRRRAEDISSMLLTKMQRDC